MINRYELAAIARAIVYLAIGCTPFAVIGLLVSWWLAIGVLVVAAGASGWLAWNRWLGRPW